MVRNRKTYLVWSIFRAAWFSLMALAIFGLGLFRRIDWMTSLIFGGAFVCAATYTWSRVVAAYQGGQK
jgi:hypothetical protein